jgi:hypothetical protein
LLFQFYYNLFCGFYVHLSVTFVHSNMCFHLLFQTNWIMKKIICLSMIFFATFINCDSKKTTPEDKLKEEAEKLLLSKLDDPSSYEFISFKYDTIKRDIAKQDLVILNKMALNAKTDLEKQAIEDRIKLTPVYKDNQIEFMLKYRIKNKLNTIVLDSLKVISDQKYNLIEVK